MDSWAIIDAGGTSTDIYLLAAGIEETYTLPGFNPLDYEKNFAKLDWPQINVDCIYYYGSGVVNSSTKSAIEHLLSTAGLRASKYFIASDLVGAARAALGDEDGHVAILGTGAIACQYADGKIDKTTPALGYIFGDSGSGASIGKQVIFDYFHHRMPIEISRTFNKKYGLDRPKFVSSLYNHRDQRAYLASFSRFLNEVESDWKEELLRLKFDGFLENCTNHFDESFQEVSFVGSVASNFALQLRKVAERRRIKIKNIMQSPMPGLIAFHREKDKTK